MWRLLSGIALILLLDIAFIWMMASQPEAPEIALAIGPAAAIPVIHQEQNDPPQQVEDNNSPEEYDEARRGSRSFRVAKRHVARQARSFYNDNVSMSATAPANLFPDRIIWIGRTEVPVTIDREPVAVRTEVERNDDVQAELAEERPAKKRSIQSKAISVIKKPYELMKAFADKFN